MTRTPCEEGGDEEEDGDEDEGDEPLPDEPPPDDPGDDGGDPGDDGGDPGYPGGTPGNPGGGTTGGGGGQGGGGTTGGGGQGGGGGTGTPGGTTGGGGTAGGGGTGTPGGTTGGGGTGTPGGGTTGGGGTAGPTNPPGGTNPPPGYPPDWPPETPYPPPSSPPTGGSGNPDDVKPFVKIISAGSHDSSSPSDPVPNLVQGMRYQPQVQIKTPLGALDPDTGEVQLEFRLKRYIWTYPDGVLKGYGTFGTGNATRDPDGDYTYFDSNASDQRAAIDTDFTPDDRDWDPTQGDAFHKDHFIKSFYWGPEHRGTYTISVRATFDKIVNGEDVDDVLVEDEVTVNILQPRGRLDVTHFGNVGLGRYTDGGQFLGLDKNTVREIDRITDKQKLLANPGIEWEASIDPASVLNVGIFATVQLTSRYMQQDVVVNHVRSSFRDLLPDKSDPGTVLDTAFPYNKVAKFVGDSYKTQDAPHVGLLPGVEGEWYPVDMTRKDTFKTVLMYRPPDGIWVPVRSFDWGWEGKAHFVSALGFWVEVDGSCGTSPIPGRPASTVTTSNRDFPVYTHNVKEKRWEAI